MRKELSYSSYTGTFSTFFPLRSSVWMNNPELLVELSFTLDIVSVSRAPSSCGALVPSPWQPVFAAAGWHGYLIIRRFQKYVSFLSPTSMTRKSVFLKSGFTSVNSAIYKVHESEKSPLSASKCLWDAVMSRSKTPIWTPLFANSMDKVSGSTFCYWKTNCLFKLCYLWVKTEIKSVVAYPSYWL